MLQSCLDLAIAAGFDNDEFLSDRVRGGLHVSPLALGLRRGRVPTRRIAQDCSPYPAMIPPQLIRVIVR